MLRYSFVALAILTINTAQAASRAPVVVKQSPQSKKDQSRIPSNPALISQKFRDYPGTEHP